MGEVVAFPAVHQAPLCCYENGTVTLNLYPDHLCVDNMRYALDDIANISHLATLWGDEECIVPGHAITMENNPPVYLYPRSKAHSRRLTHSSEAHEEEKRARAFFIETLITHLEKRKETQ